MLKKFWQSGAVGIIILISSFLNFWNLPINGWGNGYYAVGARSMGLNLHNFFFNVYDQAGLVTLDKPPAAFWLQAISCKILGWNAWGLFFPQALAGIIAVATVYWLTAKNFGKITGIVAAVMLGVTPIAVAMNRDNNAEAILNLVLIAAAAAGLEGLRRKNNWLILLGFGLIGVGFNVKEAEAMLVLPALAATYFLTANEKFWKRSLILTIGVVLTIIVSMGWIMTVDRIPAERRPFVGSDAKNSEFDLAVYFNGIGRINLGRKMESRPVSAAQGKYQEELLSEIGKPGPLRLFKANLASQTGWLMPMIIFGIIGVIIKWKEWDINQKRTLLLFGGWMAITGLFFSVVGQYNDYYIDLMAIPAAVLTAAALKTLWILYKENEGWGGLLPIAILFCLGEQLLILKEYPGIEHLLEIFVIVPTVTAAADLAILPFLVKQFNDKMAKVVTGAAIAALLIGPIRWSLGVVANAENGVSPYARPGNLKSISKIIKVTRPMMTGRDKYMKDHYQNEKFITAGSDANLVTPIEIKTNDPVISVGGYSGNDKIIKSSDELFRMVNDHVFRFFLFNNPDRKSANGQLIKSVESQCRQIEPKEYGVKNNQNGGEFLYDCEKQS